MIKKKLTVNMFPTFFLFIDFPVVPTFESSNVSDNSTCSAESLGDRFWPVVSDVEIDVFDVLDASICNMYIIYLSLKP